MSSPHCLNRLLLILALTLAVLLPVARPRRRNVVGRRFDPDNSLNFSFVKDQTPVCRLGLGGWGPAWAWVGVDAQDKAHGDRSEHQDRVRR